MNNTISVYELLGLIKDSKAPKKIEYKGDTYIYAGDDYSINDNREDWLITKYDYFLTNFLNEKVEIIEEKTIQENISRLSYQQIGTYQLDNNDILGFIKALNEQFTKHGRKINEIVDYINKEEVDKR